MSRIRDRAICVLLMCLLTGPARPAGRAAGEDSFTIAVAPDLQQEVLDAKDTRLANRFRWLVDNRQKLNLKCALQVGDMLNWDTPDHVQYERASAAVKILEEGGYDDNSPQYVFDQLVKPYANVRLVFCGHVGTHGYRVDRGEKGNSIYQFVQTYHDNATNPVRLFTIDTKAGRIKSRVYCPSLGKDKADGSTLEIKDVEWVPAAAASKK